MTGDRRVWRGFTATLGTVLFLGACGNGTTTPPAPAPAPQPPVPEPAVPATPTGLMVSATTVDSISWTWNAVDGATGYAVQVSRDAVFDDSDVIHRTTETTFTARGLPSETSVYVRVAAAGGTRESPLLSAWTPHIVGMSAPPPVPEPELDPLPGGTITTTDENQILVALEADDFVPANLFDLSGRTLLFTPSGGSGYSRSVRPVAWEEDIGAPVADLAEIEFQGFRFPFAGQQWESFFISRFGLVTFGEPFPFSGNEPDRRGRMFEIANLFVVMPTISPLYKPHLGGRRGSDARRFANTQHVARRPDRTVVTWITSEPLFHVFGRRPKGKMRFQVVLHADGRIAFNYAAAPQDPDEAVRDGIVGLFPMGLKGDRIARLTDATHQAVPGHLDVLEVAVYESDTDHLFVEFTTRGPIPAPNRNEMYFYWLFFDTDEPWWTRRDRADEDFLWSYEVSGDGAQATGPGVAGVYESESGAENTVGLIVHPRRIPGNSASGIAASVVVGSRARVGGSWTSDQNPWTRPALIQLPGVAGPPSLVDLSAPDGRPSGEQGEVFHYLRIRDIAEVSCDIIEALGDEFNFFAFNSQFRVDILEPGPAHFFAGFYRDNVPVTGTGMRRSSDPTCVTGSRLWNTWGFPSWIKSDRVLNHDPDSGQSTPYDRGLAYFAHEIGHTWLAAASHLSQDGERRLGDSGGHWLSELHAPAPFPRRGTAAENGSVMGGNFWRENSDGTFTRTHGWGTKAGGFSWLDLYLMGLATPEEVPDMFLLRNRQRVRGNDYTGDKEIVTMEQILAVMGPRDPPAARAQKVFNAGFVYFVEPDSAPDPELLRIHAEYRDRALDHWSHVTGGRSQITTRLPR